MLFVVCFFILPACYFFIVCLLFSTEPWVQTVSGFTILWRAVVTAYASVGAGKRIHGAALSAVFASPVAFFDVTPVGRILNRFSGDVQKVDVQLAQALSAFVGYVVSLLCTLAILILNSPFTLLAMPPLGVMYVIYSSYYRISPASPLHLPCISRESPLHLP